MLIATDRGLAAALSQYSTWEKMSSPPYTIDENTLINLGYHFLIPGQVEPAIQIFKLEVQDYPKFWNAYDSLGEAYMKAGQKDLAIQNYEKSVELKPDNQSGIDALKKLKEQK
jgi:tetratricopeptide (TPR) repeat protein